MSTQQRREREKAERRMAILDAARLEFFERGFHRPTVDDIAARAEVSKGTIYLYFESREAILAHLLLEGLALLQRDMKAASNLPQPSQTSTLRALAAAYLQFCTRNPSYFRLTMAFDRGRFEESIPSATYRQVQQESMNSLGLLVETVRAGQAAGEFVAGDPWRLAGSIWASLNGVLVLMAHPLRRSMLQSDTASMFDTTLDIIIRGLTLDLPTG